MAHRFDTWEKEMDASSSNYRELSNLVNTYLKGNGQIGRFERCRNYFVYGQFDIGGC